MPLRRGILISTLKEQDAPDFSSIQAETYWMLKRETEVLDKVRSGITHIMVEEYQDTDCAYCGLMYRMFTFEPFASKLDTDLSKGAADVRTVRNLSQFMQVLRKYENDKGISVLSPGNHNKLSEGAKEIDNAAESLFNFHLRYLYEGGMGEFEDESDYAPSGCVSFLTIHRAKGMEFPISISNADRSRTKQTRCISTSGENTTLHFRGLRTCRYLHAQKNTPANIRALTKSSKMRTTLSRTWKIRALA